MPFHLGVKWLLSSTNNPVQTKASICTIQTKTKTPIRGGGGKGGGRGGGGEGETIFFATRPGLSAAAGSVDSVPHGRQKRLLRGVAYHSTVDPHLTKLRSLLQR